jgi:RNA polymerase sigma-70 factor, ECF subfamily
LQFQPFDEPYVERLRAGDPRTQEHFVAYFSELIQLKVRARLRTVQAMEDVKQETFARVLTKLRTPNGIRSPERLGSFVNSICNNVLLEQYRENHRTISIENESDQDFPDHDTDVEREVADRQMEQKVRQILDEMPERDRRILRAIFLEERDKDELCREFGVARDYLRVLLHRAKKAFKEEYRKIIDRGIDKRP